MTEKELLIEIDIIISKTNPCNFKNGYCRREQFLIEKYGFDSSGYYACCGDEETYSNENIGIWIPKDSGIRCRFLGDKGCTIKHLTCKLWFCEIAEQWIRENYPKEFGRLMEVSELYRKTI